MQAAEADVDTDHGDDLALVHQREGHSGHQHLAARGAVEIRVEHAGLAGLQRAQLPGVERAAVEHGRGVGDHVFGHCQAGHFTGGLLRPVGTEAALLVAAGVGLVMEGGVLAVQRIGLEDHVEAEQVRIALEAVAHQQVEVLAYGGSVRTMLGGLIAQLGDLSGELVAEVVNVGEEALDDLRLLLAARLHPRLGRVLEHVSVGRLDQLRIMVHPEQREADQQADDTEQAEAGQQRNLPLDRKAGQGHGGASLGKSGSVSFYRLERRLLERRP